MSRDEIKGNGPGRDSTSYILNFITVGVIVIGLSTLVIAIYLGISPIEWALIGAGIGSLAGWITGSLFDIRKEVEFRSEIRRRAAEGFDEVPAEVRYATKFR